MECRMVNSRLWTCTAILVVSGLVCIGSAAETRRASKATPAQVADFWATVFKGTKPHGVPPLRPERKNPRAVGHVTLWDVSFDSYRDPDTNEPVRLAGILGIPNRPGQKFPGLVVTHSVGAPYPAPDNVEQMATFFAETGYVALAFFMRGYGASRMAKLGIDSARGRMDGFYVANLVHDGQEPFDTVWAGFPVDMFQAGEFLAQQPEVTDPNALAVIGHSGGGYAALVAGIFNKRYKVIVASAPAATCPDPDAWMKYWKNSPWQRWAESQPDPAVAMSRATRVWSYTGVYQTLNNPNLLAKDRNWKLKNTAVWFYSGENDPAVPPSDIEAAWRLADSSNQKVFHRSPSGGHGGPESWIPAQSWLAGHYPGRIHRQPQAEIRVISQRGGAVILSGETSSSQAGIVGWEYDFGDGNTVHWGPTIGHTYQRPGNYTAKLTVTNGAGLRSTASVRVPITAAAAAGETARVPSLRAPKPAASAKRTRLEAGQATGRPGDAVFVPIVFTGPEDSSVTSITITLGFDAKILVQPRVARGPAVPGPAWWNFTARAASPGEYTITAEEFVRSPGPILNGVIGHMVFTIPISAPTGVYPLTVKKFEVNNGTFPSEIQSGSVRIEAKDR